MNELDQKITILQIQEYANQFNEETYSQDSGIGQSILDRILELQEIIALEQSKLDSALALLTALGE